MTVGRTVVIGEQRFDGVLFFPAPASNLVHRIHATGRPDVLHVSTDDLSRTAHIRQALIDRIGEARHKVFFCSFLFADDEIVKALCAASERLRGGVYVLTALGKHLRAEVLEPDAEVDANTAKLQERARRHDEHLQRLADAGVWLRSAEDCHAKFCVVDDAIAIVTSANATQEAYESNPEDGLVVHSPPVARELGRLFAHVWQHFTTLESTPGTRLDVHTLPTTRKSPWTPLTSCDGIDPVVTLREDEHSLVRAAIDVIDSAQQRLRIATYSLMGMETHPIGDALRRAVVERGVEIELLLQPRNHIAAQSLTCAWLVGLAPSRVHLHGHRRTHTKSIVADDQVVLLWTGNLEAAHGWDDGIEVGLKVTDPKVAAAVAGWTSDVMLRETHVALVSPTVREVVEIGQPNSLTGDWLLHLPASTLDRVADAVERRPLELLEWRGGLIFRCGDRLLFDARINESARRIDGQNFRRVERLAGSRSLGWVSSCTLHLIPEAERPREQPRGPRQQNRRGRNR